MVVLDLVNPDEDHFASLPIQASNVQRVLTVVISDHGGSGASFVRHAPVLCETGDMTVANMDTGIGLVRYNPDPGEDVNTGHYPDAATIYAAWPAIVSGKKITYRYPIPAFTGADRFIVFGAQHTQIGGGDVLPRLTISIDRYPAACQPAEFTEHSGDANHYRSFGITAGGYQWGPRSTLVVIVGNDGNSAVNHRLYPVVTETDQMELNALTSGIPLITPTTATASPFNGVPGMQFAVPEGASIELRFPLPDLPQGETRFPLFYYDDDAISDIHTTFLVYVEGPRTSTIRAGIGSSRRGLGPR